MIYRRIVILIGFLFIAMTCSAGDPETSVPGKQLENSEHLAQTAALIQLADESAGQKKLDVKAVFRNICGFCHENYGRRPGKAPQLMNSERTDDFIFNRIKNGMPGRMAAFGAMFSDDQIRQIIKFIRSLKLDQDPQNP
jgi:mono/diheme cytochrome c family protein